MRKEQRMWENKEIIIFFKVNARLSRSSALASKATGYPLGKRSTRHVAVW